MRLRELLQHAQDPSRLGSPVAFLFRLRLVGLPLRQLRMVEVVIQLASLLLLAGAGGEVLHRRLHLVVLETVVIITQAIRLLQYISRILGIRILLESEDGIVALVADAVDMRDHQTQDLLDKDQNLHLIHGRELGSHFVAVQTVLPMSRHVVDVE
ncbi:hypothetical protein KC345_g227 [Hortaea werneckii]|nr:hypothetical protein KC345_g227 [Hortaea werneckii]